MSKAKLDKLFVTWMVKIKNRKNYHNNAQILIYKSYQCFECFQPCPTCRSANFDVVHPDLMQLPDSVRTIFPFILNPNSAQLSKSTVTTTIALIEDGTKFNCCANIQGSYQNLITRVGNAEKTILFQNFEEFRTCNFNKFIKSLRRNYAWFLRSRSKFLRNMYFTETIWQESFLQRRLYQNLRVSNTISMVHP